MVESEPSARFAETCQASLYLNHPYDRPVIGWEHENAGLTRSTAMDFYRTHYAPNNAVLVVAGDVDPDEVRELAAKHFGPIPASPAVAPRQRPQEPPHLAPLRLAMHDARVSEPVLRRTYLAPQRRAGDQSEAAALAVLAELLGGGEQATSVMGRDLVMKGLAIGAWATYADTGLDAQTFDVYLVPTPGVSLAEAEAALDDVIARFVESEPDAANLARIKGQVRAAEVYVLDDLVARGSRIGAALTSGLTLDDVADWPDVLQAVTAEDVQEAAKTVFRIDNSVTCSLAPPDAPPEGLAP
jgi:zinc protease